MNDGIIELALDDFGLSLDAYRIVNKQILEQFMDRLIILSDDVYKEQLLISQSIILESMVDRRVTFSV